MTDNSTARQSRVCWTIKKKRLEQAGLSVRLPPTSQRKTISSRLSSLLVRPSRCENGHKPSICRWGHGKQSRYGYGVPGRKAQSPHSTRYRNNSQGQQRKRGAMRSERGVGRNRPSAPRRCKSEEHARLARISTSQSLVIYYDASHVTVSAMLSSMFCVQHAAARALHHP